MDAPNKNRDSNEEEIGVESEVEFEIITDDQDASCNTNSGA